MGINSSMIEISFPSCNSLPCTKSMMLGYIWGEPTLQKKGDSTI
jgi:hypothetical protein